MTNSLGWRRLGCSAVCSESRWQAGSSRSRVTWQGQADRVRRSSACHSLCFFSMHDSVDDSSATRAKRDVRSPACRLLHAVGGGEAGAD